MKKSLRDILVITIVIILIFILVIVFLYTRKADTQEKYTLSGEVTSTDDMGGQIDPDSSTDVLVFPVSDLEFFRNSANVTKYKSEYYIRSDQILRSYTFVNTDTLGKYQFELSLGEYFICFGSKTPNEIDFERFYPVNCYQFEIQNSEISINYGGERIRSVDCKNTYCKELEIYDF
ncbi:hypothetical protein HYT51_00545 [Candidatus Woesearchaeota archaeon]|nr:hypothetical protein [Candidatus Woesearchaeota archaeon]